VSYDEAQIGRVQVRYRYSERTIHMDYTLSYKSGFFALWLQGIRLVFSFWWTTIRNVFTKRKSRAFSRLSVPVIDCNLLLNSTAKKYANYSTFMSRRTLALQIYLSSGSLSFVTAAHPGLCWNIEHLVVDEAVDRYRNMV